MSWGEKRFSEFLGCARMKPPIRLTLSTSPKNFGFTIYRRDTFTQTQVGDVLRYALDHVKSHA